MQINAQTKIAQLLKQHPDALEAIVSLSPDFKKLRNPVLRTLMAGRTSIAMASKIGGCTPEDFFEKLKPLGFQTESGMVPDAESEEKPSLPDFLRNADLSQLVSLDVRPILADGTDPLKQIQQAVKELKDTQILLITNTFEPTPLIRLLEKQGFRAFVDRVEPDHIETYFYREKPPFSDNSEIITTPQLTEAGSWDQVLQKYPNPLELDVRDLEMPGPMISILQALENLATGQALYVHHKKVPVFLLSELNNKGFDYRIKEINEGNVKLIIFKA